MNVKPEIDLLANHHLGKYFFTKVNRQNAIFELDQRGNVLQKLTFAVPQPRNYYKVGDYILFGEYDRRWLEICIFPELKSRKRELSLIQFLYNEMTPNQKYGYRIDNIFVGEGGKGKIQCTSGLFFDDYFDAFREDLWDYQRLCQAHNRTKELNAVAGFISTVVDFISLVLPSGGASKALKAAGIKIIKRQVGKEFRRKIKKLMSGKVIRFLIGAIPKLLLTIAKTFSKNYIILNEKKIRENKLKVGVQTLTHDEIEQIWVRVVKDVVGKMLDIWASEIFKYFKGLKVQTPELMKSLKKEMKEYLSKKIITFLVSDPMKMTVNAFCKSYLTSKKNRQMSSMSKEFYKVIYKEGHDYIIGIFKGLPQYILSNAAKE
ncbi:hypothetical protein KC799_08255 [candidate division KSB1 bacterium]|nr:hypothetical protein [candidate division KSB1 bacterium]